MLDPIWLELYGSCTHCHTHCITCTTLLYPENTPLKVFSYLWPLPSLHRLFSNNPRASGGGDVILMSYLDLSILQSLIFAPKPVVGLCVNHYLLNEETSLIVLR